MKENTLSYSKIKKSMESSTKKIHPIVIYGLENCPYCKAAYELLDQHKIKYHKIVVSNDENEKEKYKKLCSMNTFPMIFVRKSEDSSKYIKIGGFSDLKKYIDLLTYLRENDIHIQLLHEIDQLL